MTENLSPARALTTTHHLACVSGPDRGLVLPLVDGATLGRQTVPTWSDPSVSRLHARVRLGGNTRRAVGWLILSSGREVPLRPGRKVQLGAGQWQVRARPTNLSWPSPTLRRAGGVRPWLRWLPLLLIGWWIWRYLPLSPTVLALAVGGALCLGLVGRWAWQLRRRHRLDGAFLSLAWAANRSARSRDGPVEPVAVWTGSWGRGKLGLAPGEAVGVIGTDAGVAARWLAVQGLVQRGGLRLEREAGDQAKCDQTSGDQANDDQAGTLVLSDERGQIRLSWAPTVGELPEAPARLVQVCAPVGPRWLEQLGRAETAPSSLPSTVSATDLGLDLSVEATASRWRDFTWDWAVPVGLSPDPEPTIFTLDLPGQGPHALLAGATGSGKTVALQTWLWSLAIHVPPSSLRLILIDYKGGAGLQPLLTLPHVEVAVSDLEVDRVAWVIRRLRLLLQERKVQLRAAGYADLRQWEAAHQEGLAPLAPARFLVVIDEFQALAEDQAELLGAFTRLATQGRSLGLHLLVATQRPGHAISADLRAAIDLRIGLRFAEVADSVAILGDGRGAELPRNPGVAYCGPKLLQFAQLGPLPLPEVPPGPRTNWPVPLPTVLVSGPDTPRMELGVREGNPELVRVSWVGGALGIAAPRSAQAEVQTLAHRYGAQLAQESGSALTIVSTGAEGTVDPSNLADLSSVLLALDRGAPAVLVVDDLAAVSQEFDLHGLGLEFAHLWRSLVQRAGPPNHRIVAVDLDGTPAGRALTDRLFRLPTREALLEPALLRTLPQLDADGTGVALSRGEAVSPTGGRLVALGQGFRPKAPGPFLLQTFTRWDRTQPPAAPPLHSPWPTRSAQFSWREGPRLVATTPRPGTLATWQLPPGAGAWLTQLGFTVTELSQWTGVLTLGSTPFLALEPPLELLRSLANRSPGAALWLRAHYPYPPGCGVTNVDGTLSLVTILAPNPP
ncbi:FtsK/SpoIIIE domain-containing protein [Actinomyces sp. F1_1611]